MPTKEPTTIHTDIINALADFENVKANKINPAFKARYVSLDALLEACKPVLHKHNLALIQTLVSDEGKVGIETSFLHTSGQSFSFGKLLMKAENMTAQQMGSALTYFKRQSMMTACGISMDTDTDGNGLSAPAPIAQQPQVNATKAIQAAIAQPVSAPLKQTYLPTNNAR
jgi:hypothetical protein